MQNSQNINIPSIKNNPNINFQQGINPAMQGQTSEAIHDAANNNYIANRIKASKDADPATKVALMLPIGYGLGQAMDVFNRKCTGEYSKTPMGKLGSWGDRFCKNTRIGRAFENGLRKLDAMFYKLSKKSKIMYSLRNHSTKPEWGFAKAPGAGIYGFLSMDTSSIFEEFLQPISARPKNIGGLIPLGTSNNFIKLEQYGMSANEIKAFKNSLSGMNFAQQALELQKKELELLGANKQTINKAAQKGLEKLREIAKELKVKKLGFKDLAAYQAIEGKLVDHPKEILEALSKADKKLNISVWRGGKIKSHFAGRLINLGEYYNKHLATLGKGNKTKLGRFLPKAMGWFMEGCTNRWAGGKLAPFIQAGIFADMLYHTYNAPKGEKIKTFAERFFNDFTYFVGLTAGIVGMHKIGGFKYLGTDNAGRQNYRKLLEQFNKDAKAGLFNGNKALYKQRAAAVDAALNVKNLKWYQKGLQKLGKFINMGNEAKVSYHSTSKLNMNIFRKIFGKNLFGVPLRIAIPLAVVTPFLVKLVTKGVHAIFGRPTYSVLDEDKEDEKTNNAENPQAQQPQAIKPSNINVENLPDSNLIKQAVKDENKTGGNIPQVQPQKPTDVKNLPDSNLIKQEVTGQKPNPVPVNVDPNKEYEPERHYIPSPYGMVPEDSQDQTAGEQALQRADMAEKRIQEILSMK